MNNERVYPVVAALLVVLFIAMQSAADEPSTSREGTRTETGRTGDVAAVAGRLVTMTLAPIGDRRLLCYLAETADRKTPVPLEARTDANGDFRFQGVPVGAQARLVAIDALEGTFGIGAAFSVKQAGTVRLGDLLEREFSWKSNHSSATKGWIPAIPPESAELKDRLTAAYAELAKTYRLEKGENVRHFSPPYPETRWRLIKDFFSSQGDLETKSTYRDWFFRFSFHNGKILQNGGASVHHLGLVIQTVCDLTKEEIEGDDKLLGAPVAGDFVVRLGASVEQRVRELEQILWNETSLRVLRARGLELNLQQETRKVFVAAGDFLLKPLPRQKNVITVYGQTPPEAVDLNFGGGGSGILDEFLKALGGHVNQRIVRGAGTQPSRQISWRFVEGGVFNKRPVAVDRDPKLVLKHVAEQTGLTFREEKRPVRVLRVE